MKPGMMGAPPMGGGMPPRGGGMGAPPPGGGGALGKLQGQESMFNPTDMASQASRGAIGPNTTIREFLGQQGIDVDGPISQLAKGIGDQLRKANPLNKMKAMGGQPGGAPPMGGQKPMGGGMPPSPGMGRPSAPPPGGGGMEGLMSKIGR